MRLKRWVDIPAVLGLLLFLLAAYWSMPLLGWLAILCVAVSLTAVGFDAYRPGQNDPEDRP